MEMGSNKHAPPAGIAHPRVTLSYAQSLDGCIAIRRDEPYPISSPESLKMTHQLRAAHDAILVGIGTVFADDPQLTVRLAAGLDPQPIILDSHLRFPSNARLLGNPRPPWIVTTLDQMDMSPASEDRRTVLKSKGAKVFAVPASPNGRVALPAMLSTLYDLGIRTLMVEGGAKVITAFLKERLVDEVVLTLAPVFIGGLRAVESLALVPSHLPRLNSVIVERSGPDWVLRGSMAR